MITFAKDTQKQDIMDIWKISFPNDNQEFIDTYFADKYKSENTLIYLLDNKVVSCLQILPYTIEFHNYTCQISYISGAATLPDYKNRGIMGQLLTQSFHEMKNRGDIFTILIPQEAWLINFYKKYGYFAHFEHFSTKIYDCSACFLDIFTFLELDNTHVRNVMTRVLNVEKALHLYASFHNQLVINIKAQDYQIPENNGIFCLYNGNCNRKHDECFDMKLSINYLTEWLFKLS